MLTQGIVVDRSYGYSCVLFPSTLLSHSASQWYKSDYAFTLQSWLVNPFAVMGETVLPSA